MILRFSFGNVGSIWMFWASASEVLYEVSVHAESNATPSMEFEVAAASFLVLFVFVVDSQLGNCMLSVLVILELVLKLLFNILL